MATQKPTRKKPKTQTPESQFNRTLNTYSKSKDLRAAISLYDAASSQNTRLNLHHFNTLLYLCSASLTDPSTKPLSLESGFRIFGHMMASGIRPNEASVTSVARLAAAKGDGDYAFDLVRNSKGYDGLPRLRSFDPALLCFCGKLEAEKAYEVEERVGELGLCLEEPQLAELLRVSAGTGKDERVYVYLHKLRKAVRCVKEETAEVIGDWFKSFEGNGVELDVGLLRETVRRNGGGWHGLGWIGKGRWVVRRGNVGVCGKCSCCRERLDCVDIDDLETERFANSVVALAMEREAKANFKEFQDWLDKHGDYQAIVDGANVAFYQQNFAEGGFCIPQIDAVVKELYKRGGEKYPLIILHNKRYRALLENHSHRKLIEEWSEKGALYITPHGSNDDWYWLYAAVKLRCLIVTNDEMRDHIFELIGSNFFLKWKERHQVRYTFAKGEVKLQMPPPYSVVIQESVKGSWHVPIAGGNNENSAQSWLCICIQSFCEILQEDSANVEMSENCDGRDARCNNKLSNLHKLEHGTSCNGGLDAQNSFRNSDNKCRLISGKRKERSPSP